MEKNTELCVFVKQQKKSTDEVQQANKVIVLCGLTVTAAGLKTFTQVLYFVQCFHFLLLYTSTPLHLGGKILLLLLFVYTFLPSYFADYILYQS